MNATTKFRVWSAIAGLAGVALLVLVVALVQTRVVFKRAAAYAEEGIETIRVNLEYQTEPELCRFAQELTVRWGTPEAAARDDLAAVARKLHVDRVTVVGTNGIVLASSAPKAVGFDFASHSNTVEFLALNRGEHYVVQPFRHPVDDARAPLMKFVGIAFPQGGFVQIGDSIHPGDAHRRDYVFVQSMQDEHISNDGFFVIVDPAEGRILSTLNRDQAGGSAKDAGLADLDFGTGDGPVYASVFNRRSLVWRMRPDFFNVVGYVVFPLSELMHERNVSVALSALVLLAVFVAVYVFFLKINAQSVRLREQNVQMEAFHAREAASRQRDLQLAKSIQATAMPCVFPPFPQYREIDLHALFRTAREVGGDFYDFYFVSPGRLCLVIADVSDKGVPAALFMMKARSIIKSCVTTRETLPEAVSAANGMLCANNVAGMFVTAWVGVFDLESGALEFVSAGHNPPYIRRLDGTLETLRVRPSLVLAAMDGVSYRSQTAHLNPGDALVLYTDGVTEAMAANGDMFGEKRLEATLRAFVGDAETFCRKIVSDVDAFAQGVPQSDDITVLVFGYRGSLATQTRTFSASLEGLAHATQFLQRRMDGSACAKKAKDALLIALDEIASNIVRHSGAPDFTLKVSFDGDLIRLVFTDAGKPYNPLGKADPDIRLPTEERPIGGLGLFMVRRMMDEMTYAFENGRNVLTLGKKRV